MMRVVMAVVITLASITIAQSAGMIVSPGSFMGMNSKGGAGGGVPSNVITTEDGLGILTEGGQLIRTET
jgi:hypothetical protein